MTKSKGHQIWWERLTTEVLFFFFTRLYLFDTSCPVFPIFRALAAPSETPPNSWRSDTDTNALSNDFFCSHHKSNDVREWPLWQKVEHTFWQSTVQSLYIAITHTKDNRHTSTAQKLWPGEIIPVRADGTNHRTDTFTRFGTRCFESIRADWTPRVNDFCILIVVGRKAGCCRRSVLCIPYGGSAADRIQCNISSTEGWQLAGYGFNWRQHIFLFTAMAVQFAAIVQQDVALCAQETLRR